MSCVLEKLCPPKEQPIEFDYKEEARCNYLPSESRWAKVTFSWSGINKEYLRDTATDEIYNDDDALCVRIKCLALIPATIAMTVARLVAHIATCIIKREFLPPVMLYYGPLCVKASVTGVFMPFEARGEYALYERALLGVPNKDTCFIAPCFQPINCSVENKSDKSLNLLALKRRILRALRE